MRKWGNFIKRYLTSVHKVVFGDMSNLWIQVASNLIGNRVNNWGDLIWEFLVLIQTSVACAIGPSVNTFFYFSHFQDWKFLISMVWTHTHLGLNWFFLPNPNFAICLNFQQQNPLKINTFHTLALTIVEYTLLNLTCQGLPNNTKKCPQIPIRFSVWILFSFHWVNGSIASTL
jgi:hypothetical protein